MACLAYLITVHTYGTWLHGRAEGSVDKEHNKLGTPPLDSDPEREAREFHELKCLPIKLDAERRFIVADTIREVCAYRGWDLRAEQVRTTHFHAVVSAEHTPERVMTDLKAYTTRRMRESGILDQDIEPWSFHGSTRYMNTENSLVGAIRYVLHEQGAPLEMKCPRGWKARGGGHG